MLPCVLLGRQRATMSRQLFDEPTRERVTLFNQCRVLELLDKDEADYYAELKEALLSGYEYEYDRLFDRFEGGLSEEECPFVRDVYGMYEALQRGYDELPDKTAVNVEWTKYFGYDGNNETLFMGYSRYLHEDRGLWKHVRVADHNSHMPHVAMYRDMLERYEALDTHEPDLAREKRTPC